MANNKENKSSDETSASGKNNVSQSDLGNSITYEDLARIARMFNTTENGSTEDNNRLTDKLNEKLTQLRAISVAFPECSDVMLSLLKSSETDEITVFFNEYFTFKKHSIMANEDELVKILDSGLTGCVNIPGNVRNNFPPPWCLPPTCVTLEGNRREFVNDGVAKKVKRLFVADLVWLFYFERMGIFKILGAILDDYAIKGKFPITNDSPTESGGTPDKIELVSIILESMTRKTKMGISSTVRDRNITYRRALGWIQEEGRKLDLDTTVNTAFTNLFHKFIQTSLEYFKDKRLATAIQASTNVNRVSVATLTSIKDTIDLLLRAFDPFRYGRVYSNTLSGIVWVIAGMALIREMRTTLGIPFEYKEADEFIPAAYDLLVTKNSGGTQSETNRYDVHRDCAENARDILLDIEALDYKDIQPNGDLETWLNIIEGKVEGYRTAYRSLTGVDLGEAGTPRIEQQV